MASSSSPTPPSTSTLIALASPSFIAVFLLPHTSTLALKLSLSFSNTSRSIFHRPYYDRVTFVLPALSSFLYGVGGVFSLLSITRYTQDGGDSSLGRGFMVVHGVTQAIGRFGAIVCLLVLLSTFGPRSSRRASRAHLAPFTTVIVVFLFVLGLASMVLSIYLSFSANIGTTTIVRILSIIQPSLYLAALFLTLATFALLSVLFRFAAAISRPDGNRGSVAEDFLASKAVQYGVQPTSTSTLTSTHPPPRRVRHLNYSSTISKLVPQIFALTFAGLAAASLQLADRLLDRNLSDTTHIGMVIGRGVCEVLWIGGITQLLYGLCKPRLKAQRTHTEEVDDPAVNPHLPPSSSGNHLLQTRSLDQVSSSSPGSASTTLPHTPATPQFPFVPKANLRDETAPGSESHQHPRRGPVANVAAYASTYLEAGSTLGLDGAGVKPAATVSEEFLALRTDDPFSSPPPGTVVLPMVPPSGGTKKRKGTAVVENPTSEATASAIPPSLKSKTRPKTSSSDDVLSDGWNDSDEGAFPTSNFGRGPISKKARTVDAREDVYGAHGSGSARLSKRSSQKPTFSRRPSNKRRRSGGVIKSKKETPVEMTSGVRSPFADAPSVVSGTTRPRPPRSPISRLSRRAEETNSLGLVVNGHRSMPGPSAPSQDPRRFTAGAFNAAPAINEDERLLKSVLTNALGLKRHQQTQYLDPAAAALQREAGLSADYSIDGVGGAAEERDRRSGSATPTPKFREDAGPTPRGGSPTVESNVPSLLPQERRKDFKFTTIVESSVSTGTGSPVPFPHQTMYQHPAFEEPARLHDPTVGLLDSLPCISSLPDAASSIASLPSLSDLANQSTPSPDQLRTPYMLTNDPPSSFEASAPIDIPATRMAARNHHRRRAPSASILEAARAMPMVSPLGNAPVGGGGGGRLHKPNSNSYDAAGARARGFMAGAETGTRHHQTNAYQNQGIENGVANNTRLWLTRLEAGPTPTNGGAEGEIQGPPTSIGSPDLPLVKSRFSDPTTVGTGSSGGRTNSTGGADAGSESSFN